MILLEVLFVANDAILLSMDVPDNGTDHVILADLNILQRIPSVGIRQSYQYIEARLSNFVKNDNDNENKIAIFMTMDCLIEAVANNATLFSMDGHN